MSWFSRFRETANTSPVASNQPGGLWMPWQHERVILEIQSVKSALPAFEFMSPSTTACEIVGTWRSELETYQIVVKLGAGFPDSCPSVYITKPFPLFGHEGQRLHELGTTHSMHLLSPDRDRATKVCMVKSEFWDASYSVVQLVKKAQLWILAFEFHRESGQPVDDFLLNFD